jgi:dipeptidyl aminopeptidase/acylaminoacyl peptidase
MVPPGAANERDLTWLDYSVVAGLSADGKSLLFSEQGVAGGPQYATYLRPTDGGPAIRLGKGDARALSPDGRWALVIDLAPPSQLVLLPTGAGEAQRLPRHTINHYQTAWWLPDGRSVMFTASEAGRPLRLYVQEVGGGAPRPVTPEGAGSLADTVSPDGRFVAAVSESGGGIYPVAGGESRPVPGWEPGELPLFWGTDGRSLYVRRLGEVPVRIYRLDIVTGQRALWKELGPPDLAGVSSIGATAITRDARWYAYTYHSRLSNLYLVEGLK